MKANKTIRWKIRNKKTKRSIVVGDVRGFSRKYLKDIMVYAPKWTFGLMCFIKKKYANDFIKHNSVHKWSNKAEIIKVKTYGKGIKPSKIAAFNTATQNAKKIIKEWYLKPEERIEIGFFTDGNTGEAPEGTICYPAVMPLE